jgi:hypothetical protein
MDKIICGLATMVGREEALKETVMSIINQVDKLIVYQNGYSEIFDFLKNEKIEVYSSVNTGIDMGDAGKFYKLSEYKDHYYLSIDDDLIYPLDYVSNLLNNLKDYNNKIIVTHHGRTLRHDAKSYYRDVKVKYKCLDDVYNYEFVHFGGTGVMAFHTSFVKLKFEYIKTPNMADIWVGLFARENNIPILVLPHKSGWIKYSDKIDENKTIYNTHLNNSTIQDSLIIHFDKSKIIKYENDFNYKMCFLIPSYNRYDKLSRLLTQINNETTAKVIIYNDASTDNRYLDIEKQFMNVKVIHGSKNNGKANYQQTMSTLFTEANNSDSDYFILIADDFILCKSFQNIIKPYLNEYYITNVFSLRPEGWGRLGWVDGAFSASKGGLSLIHSILPKTLKNVENKSTGVWKKVTDYFTTVNKTNYKLIALNYSLTQHDGNDDSKLHPIHRLKTPIVAHNFYDDYYGDEIKVTGESKYNGDIKKKSSDATPNGNSYNKTSNTEIKLPEKGPESKPINNSQTTSKPVKLHKPEQKNTISRIPNDIALGKLRKSNLRFGKR